MSTCVVHYKYKNVNLPCQVINYDPAAEQDKREADVQLMNLMVAAAHLPELLTN